MSLNIQNSIIDQIGNTSIIQLHSIIPDNCANIFLKMENKNPTGSMKDRMALAMIEAAEKDGRLKKGQYVVEYTGGSTGVSLALICVVKGYPLHIVTSDAFSQEKRRHMEALGAELTVIPSKSGDMDEELTRSMIEKAREITDLKNAYWTDQLNNEDQLSAYRKMGDEIWRQTGGNVDVFIQSTGTAASIRGTSESLKNYNSSIQTIAVEPTESAVLSGRPTGSHKIEGVGAGFVVPLWQMNHINQIETVTTEEAMNMARKLAKYEGILAGTSTGGNVTTAIKIGKQLGPSANIVTVMCDTGMKYLSTTLYGN